MGEIRNKILWHKYVQYETIADYLEGVEWLRREGFVVYGVVIDGIRGLAGALWPYPVQLCQFHQMLIIRRYLTRNPELEASSALLHLVNSMTKTDNGLEGIFSDIKSKVRVHSGLTREHRKKLIDEYLFRHY